MKRKWNLGFNLGGCETQSNWGGKINNKNTVGKGEGEKSFKSSASSAQPKIQKSKNWLRQFLLRVFFNFFPLFSRICYFYSFQNWDVSGFVSHLAGLALICTSIENSKSLLPLPLSFSFPPYLTATLFFKRFNSFFSCCCCCGWERVRGRR